MENQNILTIKFNTVDDLATQVADWHERLNHQCKCMSEKPTVKVTAGTSLELAESKLKDTFKKAIQKSSKKISEGITQLEAAGCNVKVLENESSASVEDGQVTNFEGKQAKTKKEESAKVVTESLAEPAPATTEEQAAIETPEQDAVLDVTTEPVDKKAFYKEFREWMGNDTARARQAMTIFHKHGVNGKVSSDVLTDDIITDLKSTMAGEE